MKKRYSSFIISLVVLLVVSCQQDDLNDNIGYLRIEIGTNAYVDTRIAADYNPKQIALQILNSKGEVVESTDDWETLSGKQIRLTAGTYTVKASSNGFDGSESGFDIPYYAGSQQITVQTGKEVTANVTCTLANVKVTVNYDQSFKEAFLSATATVKSDQQRVNELSFRMGEELKSAYFPVADLTAIISVINHAGKSFSQDTRITGVKARKHYILNFKVAETGDIGGVSVSVDGTEYVYTFTFNVSTETGTKLGVEPANAWSNFAYIKGSIDSQEAGTELDANNMKFEYKLVSDENWTSIAAQPNGENSFTATLPNLKPATQYNYRMVYNGENDETFSSDISSFTTESQETIPNLSFDDWCTVKNGGLFGNDITYYAASNYDNLFWDSGNEGANTMSAENPTRPEETDVKAGKAAKLTSKSVVSQFAAGSLFTGKFGSASISPLGAKLDFGRPFTGRPTQLKGYYKYNPGNIDYINTDRVSAVKKGDRDLCSIYILLADWDSPFAVSTGDDIFVNINDPSVIAYGELSAEKTSPQSMDEYEEFTIDIKYRDITRKPTYILIVCSSSKYGDYFTGSTSSVLLLDEFQLIYSEPILA